MQSPGLFRTVTPGGEGRVGGVEWWWALSGGAGREWGL